MANLNAVADHTEVLRSECLVIRRRATAAVTVCRGNVEVVGSRVEKSLVESVMRQLGVPAIHLIFSTLVL